MSDNALQLVLFAAVILALTPVMGSYMYLVYSGQRSPLSPVLEPAERLI